MKIDNNAGILGLLVGAAGLIWAGYVSIKCNKIADKVGVTLDDISSSSNIQIKESMVNQAVQNAVDRAANDMVAKATTATIDKVASKMNKEISTAVEEAYSDVKGDVKSRLESQIGNVNIDRVRREIVNEGKEKAAKVFGDALDEIKDTAKDKFEEELNSILNHHNDELNSVTRIYGSIADAIGNRSSGATLRIG